MSNRIAMITHTFLPQFIGGREKHVFYLSKELIRQGFEVSVFTGGQNSRFECVEYEGITTYRFPMHTLSFPANREKIPYRVINPANFIRTLGEYNPDIVHAHDYRHFTTDIAALYSKTRNKPFILTVHGFFYEPNWLFRALMKLYDKTLGQLSIKTANRIIFVSSRLAGEYKHSKPENRIAVIPNGAPLYLPNYFQKHDGDFRERHGLNSDKLILAVGRLGAQKGFQYLIPALKKILERNTGYQLCIIGPKTGYEKELAHLADNIKSIVFTGPISESELEDAYRTADLFVLSSLAEGSPLTILEAMAFGKPIVATSVGTVPEIIRDGINGIIVKPRNSDSLAEAITRVLDDSSFAGNLGKNAQEDALKYWEGFVSGTQGVYESVLKRGEFCD